jgi:[acyl-carrier-protein] S-malonyltransferase
LNKSAFLFPGQASQYVGMGKDLYDLFPKAKEIFDTADQIMNTKLSKICFEGPEDELKQTRITQPAIFVHSMAVLEIMKDFDITPDAVAGHSLGEYSALVTAGALSFEDGLNLVKIRGELMQKAGTERPGTMAAIIGLGVDQINDICESVKHIGVVKPANYNSPGQIAISGDVPAVHAAMQAAKDAGARKAVELVVSGAFHSPLMQSAEDGLAEALEKTEVKNTSVPVYTNVQALPTTSATEIRNLLYKQLTNAVRWIEIIQNMISYGVHTFYEIGPGKVLTGLNRRIDRKVESFTIGTKDEIESLST